MKFKKLAFEMLKVMFLSMTILLLGSHQMQAQHRKVKKKVRAVSPAKRYAHLPKRGTYVKVVPAQTRLIRFNSIGYRFSKGIFYKPYRNQYIVVAAPMGIRITSLPIGYRSINVQKRTYFYYNGTYYLAKGKEFEVVQAPLGALVESIPDGYQEIEIEGNTYYLVEDTQYKAVIHEGEIMYEVIKTG
ncbi:MAG: DUF6515 family protein [Bacteroidota bacterium]